VLDLHVWESIAMRNLSRFWLVAALGLFVATGVLHAQRPGDIEKLGLKKDFDDFKGNRQVKFRNYLLGKDVPSGEEGRRILQLATIVYVGRITWFDSTQRAREYMEQARTDFRNEIGIAVQNADKNQEAVKVWTPSLLSAFKQILDWPFNNNRVSCVNVALLLPDLARLKRPEIADFLVTVLEDPKKHDSIKLYAAQALTEFFPATEFVFLNKGDKAAEGKKKTEVKRVNALLKFITRKWDPAKDVPKEEVDGFCFVRRTAIRALAEARVPAIEADPKTQKLEGDVIQALLPILKGEVTPEPTLAEKIEAAIAVSRMKVDPNSAYQPDESVYRVGTALVEIAIAYTKDFNKFKGAKDGVPILPWKIHAKRLQLALGEMYESVKNDSSRTTAAANAAKLQNASQSLLNAMQSHQANFDAKVLADAVNTLRPPESAPLFKGIKAAPTTNGE
jgi:hypothetical protein